MNKRQFDGILNSGVARNPILFDIFHRLHLIEKVGTGVQRVLAAIEARNLKVEFDLDSFFTIIFKRPALDNSHRKEYEAKQIEIEPIEAPGKYPAGIQQVLKNLVEHGTNLLVFVPGLSHVMSHVCPR